MPEDAGRPADSHDVGSFPWRVPLHCVTRSAIELVRAGVDPMARQLL